MGQYLYCIVKTNKKSPPLALTDINGQEARFISYGDIAAVVSSTPIVSFDRLKRRKLIRCVATHQKVNEEVMKSHNVVPMTFGVIAPSVDEVLRILERAYLQFKTALKKVEERVEFAVQAWWNQEKVLEDLVITNPEIQKLKQKASSRGRVLGIPIKLKLGELIHEGIEAKRGTYIKNIHAFLKSSSSDSTSNKLIEDDMIANFSFLIKRAKESELDKKMQELGKIYDGKLRFKYIGPMPPYSFTSINLGLGNFEVVNKARKLLGLAEVANFDEIKRAYYELAHQYHPDKHGDNREEFQEPGFDELTTRMKKIAHAYTILENYCLNCDEFLGLGKIEGRKYSFKKEDVRNSIMIK